MQKIYKALCPILLVFSQLDMNAQNLNGKIIYSTYAMPDDSIWSMNIDGTGKKFITLGGSPRVSPDQHYMAFLRGGNINKARNNIYLRDLHTKHDTLLFYSNDYVVNFDFNQSSTELTFDYSCNIYRINLNTGVISPPLINTGDCWNDLPRLSEGDSSLAFQNLHYGIYTANYDGSDAVLLPNTQHGDLDPTWSPDKKWIYFTRDYADADYAAHNYFKIHSDGTGLTGLTNFSDGDTLGLYSYGSHDGKYILTPARINHIFGIYQIATDGGAQKLITTLPDAAATSAAVGYADTTLQIETAFSEPSLFSALKIFPNPATEFAIVSIDLTFPAEIKLSLYNESGKEVEAIHESLPVGYHALQLNLRSLAEGVYYCSLSVNNKMYRLKLTVIH